MKYRCIDNQDVEELLTLNREYSAYCIVGIAVRVFRCDDKKEGTFMIERFLEVIDDNMSNEPEVSIYQCSLDTERK